MNVLTLVLLGIGFAILLHSRSPGLFVPSFWASVLASITFHLVGFALEGTFDSLVLVSLVTTSLVAFVLAFAIGLLMRSAGKKPSRSTDQSHQ